MTLNLTNHPVLSAFTSCFCDFPARLLEFLSPPNALFAPFRVKCRCFVKLYINERVQVLPLFLKGVRALYINKMYAREALDVGQWFVKKVIKKLPKLLHRWKSCRTFAPANEKRGLLEILKTVLKGSQMLKEIVLWKVDLRDKSSTGNKKRTVISDARIRGHLWVDVAVIQTKRWVAFATPS